MQIGIISQFLPFGAIWVHQGHDTACAATDADWPAPNAATKMPNVTIAYEVLREHPCLLAIV
jgi:hypothetical protein